MHQTFLAAQLSSNNFHNSAERALTLIRCSGQNQKRAILTSADFTSVFSRNRQFSRAVKAGARAGLLNKADQPDAQQLPLCQRLFLPLPQVVIAHLLCQLFQTGRQRQLA